jgi:biopolymer transport protein ExbB/TolQ
MGSIFDSNRRMWPAALALGLCSLVLVAASGCSIAKPPTETLARAETRLRTATEARADELAPMELQRARENLANAKKTLSAGQDEKARRLAEAAEVEAELAEAKADAEVTRRAADGLRRSVDALRQEIERGTLGRASKDSR